MTFKERAERYADDVISGEVPSCEYVKQACQRFRDDLERDDLEFREEEADRWCRFLEKLPHVKGKWAKLGELFRLADYQIFCTVNIFGFYQDGIRRFQDIYIEVPRKNGKTFWWAGIGLGMLTIEREHGAEVYCGATTESQAWEVFRPAKQIAEKMPGLCKQFGIEINAKTLIKLDDLSRFVPVVGNPGDGPSPSCGIVDEFHEHKTADLVDTFSTGMGARDQPLLAHITTAGSDMGGPCYAKRLDCINILKGTVQDDRIFTVIYTLDDDDEWDTIEAQIKANPNYGVSVRAEYLKGELAKARRSAVKQATYKTKHLNQWVGAKAAWMNLLKFQACQKSGLKIEDFKGRTCYAAFDLASKLDIAARAVLFPPVNGGKYTAFLEYYLPESALEDGPNAERYQGWHADGWLTVTQGNITDYDEIEQDLIAFSKDYRVKEVPYDQFQATQFSTHMADEGFTMVQVGQTVKNFSEPMKELEALIVDRNIEFELDPVLLWMMGNVTALEDKKQNIFPNKERKENLIDGVVALIMAMSRAIVHKETGGLDDFLSNPVIL